MFWEVHSSSSVLFSDTRVLSSFTKSPSPWSCWGCGFAWVGFRSQFGGVVLPLIGAWTLWLLSLWQLLLRTPRSSISCRRPTSPDLGSSDSILLDLLSGSLDVLSVSLTV
ncbi:hypothetical protein GDO81_019345 [Engystomops pustulosus]|uniref:Uncharacterized protein n=1 Tax=Engystomops pustulosus TaxID=76066 RepID=A0AAV6YA57_ENGPU|nr:hypothetical protein GDO81_019345 [Engystomops pustulosus]